MATTTEPWTFRVRQVLKIVDGDTVDLQLDLGLRVYAEPRFRLIGIDTPERHGLTRAMGDLAATTLAEMLRLAGPLEVLSYGEVDKYGGRWDGSVHPRGFAARMTVGWTDAGVRLLQGGYALRYSGTGPRPTWDPAKPYPLPPELRDV